MNEVEVIEGPHKTRRGRVVSVPWIGNLWHLWMTLNVPANWDEIRERYPQEHLPEVIKCMESGFVPMRRWITVYRWQVRKV